MKSSKQQYKFKYFEPFIIITFWILLFASPLLFSKFQNEIDWTHIFNVWKNHLPLLGLFLVHRFVLFPFLFFKDRKLQYFVITTGIIFATTSIFYIFDDQHKHFSPPVTMERPFGESLQDISENDSHPPLQRSRINPSPIPKYANFLILAVLLVGFDAGLQTSMRWAKLEQEKFKLQKESVENQLAFLKNQVSPHFFMNTLNNIHALVDIDSEEAKNSIIKLSNLMRHLLYDSEDNLTPIKKEVAFIKSYIELMQLRFTEKVTVDVNIPDDFPNKLIPPLLFTSLLENAFKHGISYEYTSFIRIVMSFTEDQLNFVVENSNHPKKTKTYSGIGIENTKKRLDLLYNREYDLHFTETKEKYVVNLKIPL